MTLETGRGHGVKNKQISFIPFIGMAQRSRRSSQKRRQMISPPFFFKVFELCGSALLLLLLLTLLCFMAGPFLVSPEQHSVDLIPQGVAKSSSKELWASKLSEHYHGCSEPSNTFLSQVSKSQSNGYLLVEASGGLNQQRTGIIDAVIVARILNATLVVPQLDHASFWKDNSNFSDIFNVDQFINALKRYVSIVEQLPRSMRVQENKIHSVLVPRKCTPDYYKENILPMLQKNKVIRLIKFDYRLSNRLDEDLQKLRCKVNYHALHFTEAIRTMGDMLVERLRQRNGRYIALHLRFEPDILAFTGCYYGGGEKEIKELGLLRKRWKNIPHRNSEKARRNGRCPLTPEEVGFMLRALGYGSDSYLYVASGEIYGGENSLASLKKMFPNFYTKDAVATQEDLHPFSAYSSRMAAIDFIVCDESDVFVTNNNGNMARMLAGRRRYFGHKRTIRSNAKKLGSLFLAKPNMTWNDFALRLKKLQKGFMGEPMEMRPGRGQFFENPSACICQIPAEMQTSNESQKMIKLPYPHVHDQEQRGDRFSELDVKENPNQRQTDGYVLGNNSDQDTQELSHFKVEYTDTEEEYPWLS